MTMKALVTKGKYKNVLEEVHQYCNDWFILKTINKTFSPSSLLFTADGMTEIMAHEKKGLMLLWYEPCLKPPQEVDGEIYEFSFRKVK